jgi:hypothetical protein
MNRLLLAILALAASISPSMSAGKPADVKFRHVEFCDIHMDNVVAYTMLVPDGWKAEGHIEWSNQRTPYPQRKISITAKDNSRIQFLPAMAFNYAEATKVAIDEANSSGFPLLIPRQQGEAPPRKLGEWLISRIAKVDKQAKKLKLVEDVRDKALEEAMAKQSRASGNAATTYEVHRIEFTFELDEVPFTQEVNITYCRNPILETRNINMQDWMLFINLNVRAPSADFERMKPMLYASSQSLRPVAKWWTQQQLVIMATTKQNHEIGMEDIKRRGRFYEKLSDDSFAAWKKSQAIDDSKQNDRINTINEVQDFRDPDGLAVKLPIHYKHYYSDGRGNYFMTNESEAPRGEWKPLEPLK